MFNSINKVTEAHNENSKRTMYNVQGNQEELHSITAPRKDWQSKGAEPTEKFAHRAKMRRTHRPG